MGFLLVDIECIGQPRLTRLWAKTEMVLNKQGWFCYVILLILQHGWTEKSPSPLDNVNLF